MLEGGFQRGGGARQDVRGLCLCPMSISVRLMLETVAMSSRMTCIATPLIVQCLRVATGKLARCHVPCCEDSYHGLPANGPRIQSLLTYCDKFAAIACALVFSRQRRSMLAQCCRCMPAPCTRYCFCQSLCAHFSDYNLDLFQICVCFGRNAKNPW